MADELKYFKGSNGKSYTVPENEVEGFRQMAQQDGVTLTETDADGNELPQQLKFRGSDGKTYDVPRNEVGDFLEMAKENGVEMSEMKNLGIGGTLKTMKEAEFGRELNAGETAAAYVPIVNTAMSANEKRKEDVLRRLYEGDYKNYLEAVKLAQTIGIPDEELQKIKSASVTGTPNAFGIYPGADEETAAAMFKEWAGPQLAERIKAREAAQQKLANNDTGFLEDATIGLVGGASALASLATKPLAAATLPMDAINRGAGLRRGQWTLDKNGNPQQVAEGDDDATAIEKGLGGAAAERVVWMGSGKIAGWLGGKALKYVPGLDKVLGKTAGKALSWKAGIGAKLSESENGRWLLKTFEILGNVNDTVHVGSLPAMMLKSRMTELADEVVGLNVPNEGEREKFMDWLGKFVSVEDNIELLTSVIGLHVMMGGYSALRARSANRSFRTDARKILIDYLEDAQMDKMSNVDLQNLCRFIQSPGLTAERAAKFIEDCRAEQQEARQKVDEGRSLTEVREGLSTLERRSDKFLEAGGKIAEQMKTDEQKAKDAAKQALADSIRAAEQAAMQQAAEEQAKKDEESRIRGAEPSEQMAALEEREVSSWEDAQAKHLIGKDEQGRWTGGARQAINIHLNGTEKMKAAVKEGRLSGDLAEELLTLSYCELGNRPKAEREALIDRIVDEANGDVEAAREMMRELRGSEATMTRQPETAYEGAVNADRMKGTELRSEDGAVMGCERFKDVKVVVNEDGIMTQGLTDALMSNPNSQADVAALLVRLNAIAEKTGLQIHFGGDENALKVANAVLDAVEREGLGKVQKKMETRARLFDILSRTALDTGATFSEAEFKEALAQVSNGRRFVDNHGNIYGFKDAEGKLHFNPAVINFNTPIHEYGHLALEAVKKINPTLWKKGMELIKDSDYHRSLLAEIEQDKESPYRDFNDELLRDEALVRMIGDKGERLIDDKGVGSELKAWLKEVWKAFKGAFGVADLTEEQVENMSLGEFVDTINAELLKGSEFGTKKAKPIEKRSIKRFDEDDNSGSNGLLRWKNDRGYLFAIPVDMERTMPGGRVVFARDDANITDWIQTALNGYTLRLSKSGKLYVEGRDGLPPDLAEIFGRYPTIGVNDGIYEQIAIEAGNRAMNGAARDMTPDALVEALRKDRASYDDWKRGRNAEAEWLEQQEEQANAEAQTRWENSGMSVVDYVRSRVEEGDPAFDLDWETAREIDREIAEGKFAISPAAKQISETTKREFADDPVTSKWKIRVEPEAFRRLAPRPLETVKPVTESTDNNSVKKAVKKLFVDFGKVHNADDGTDVSFNPNDAGKIMMQSGIDMRTFAPQLKSLFETSTLAFESPQEKFSGHKYRQNVDWFKYYVNKFVGPDGNEKYIRFTVRIENNWTKQGIHAATVSDVAVYENENAEGRTFRAHKLRGAFRGFTDFILSHYIGKGKGGQQAKANDSLAKMSVGGLYTGSAADYEKPSLLKVGTGEGSHVYGWGLYASDQRGVAENYSDLITRDRASTPDELWPKYKGKLESELEYDPVRSYALKYVGREGSVDKALQYLRQEDNFVKSAVPKARQAAEWLEKNRDDVTPPQTPSAYLYGETFFTNRAPGDESHLLKWYEPVSEENLERILGELSKSDGSLKDELAKRRNELSLSADRWRKAIEENGETLDLSSLIGVAANDAEPISSIAMKYLAVGTPTGEAVYKALSKKLGSPQAASEFLARADIDGIKYPVDSYGGKTVKDGDTAGWNYVSFRDDNINVDHKWRNGLALFAAGPALPKFNRRNFIAGRAMVAEDFGRGERTPGAMAASVELDMTKATQISQYGKIRKMSLPISELGQLLKLTTGDGVPVVIAKRLPGGAAAAHTKAGKVYLNADVWGLVDKTDAAREKDTLKQHGFFRNEDDSWRALHTKIEIAHEKNRSEDQLATQLNNLARRRTDGTEPGGLAAARQVFADQVAAVLVDLPQSAGGTLGKIQTVGKELRKELKNVLTAKGLNGADVETAMRQEAGQFLDWAYGGPIVDPATGKTTSRGDASSVHDLTGRMFGAWLVMPTEMEKQAPQWSQAIESTIANTPTLAKAFRELTVRSMSEQAHGFLVERIKRQQSLQTERVIDKLRKEAKEPISAGSKVADAKEALLVAFHDKFEPVYIRVDEKVKSYLKAQKSALKTATSPAAKAAIQRQTDLFMGEIKRKLNKLELSRTAYERGAWNEGRRYFIQMVLLENKAAKLWGLSEEDRSLYLDLQRIIETQGRSGSEGMSPRQAQMALGDMARRLGAAKWRLLQQYGDEFFGIHEREILNDARIERALGKAFVDYCRSQTHYVATKRTWSLEEIDAIEQAREAAKRAGVSGGDTVIGQMFAYAGAKGASSVVGEGVWNSRLVGSWAAKQEVRSATWEKADPLMQFGRRNQMILDLRDVLLDAGVEGVRDMERADGVKFPADPHGRYGHLNYMEDGRKRVIIVPRQISDAFRIDPDNARFLTTVNGLVRKMFIDYNLAYTPTNVRRNQDSLEKNMPGMRETYAKTGLRAAIPGINPLVDLTSQFLVRKFPTMGNLFGKHTVLFHLPKAERWAKIVEDPSAWQQELWAADAAHDTARITQLYDDFSGVMEMLRGNFLVPTAKAYTNDPTQHGFAFDAMDRKALKTLEMAEREANARGKYATMVHKVNIFKKNQAQNEHEDVLAKVCGYLHDRMFYGMQRSVEESGLMVKRNVSIAEGERSGRLTRSIQGLMAQFFNMVEKGVVRYWRNFGERPGEMLVKSGKVWIGRAIGSMLAYGCLKKLFLSLCDNDEEKARERFGQCYEYADFYHRAYQNCSDYVKQNYNFTPIWTSADGMTSLIIGGSLTDEDKLIVPTADYFAKWVAFKQGIGERPELGTTIANSTFKAITPDLQLASPAINLLRDTVQAAFIENPTDYFRGAPMYDQDIWKERNESWEMRGKFAAAVAGRLWNDFGGRALYAPDVKGVDNGRGSAPATLEAVLRKIPVLSPVIGRMLKIQVGSPDKLGKPIIEERRRMDSIIRICAKDLINVGDDDLGYHEKDPGKFEKQIETWTQRYGFTPYDVAKLKEKYYNMYIQRKYRDGYDQKELMKLFQEGKRQGRDEADVWLMISEQ